MALRTLKLPLSLVALGLVAAVGLDVTGRNADAVVLEIRWGSQLLGIDSIGPLPPMTVAWSTGGSTHSEVLDKDKITGFWQKTVPVEAPDGIAAIVVLHGEPTQKVPTSCRVQTRGTWHPGLMNKRGGITCTAKV